MCMCDAMCMHCNRCSGNIIGLMRHRTCRVNGMSIYLTLSYTGEFQGYTLNDNVDMDISLKYLRHGCIRFGVDILDTSICHIDSTRPYVRAVQHLRWQMRCNQCGMR